MVFQLKPLDVKLELDDGPYRLGDTINVTVALEPHGDGDVREARLDLVCEERYTETYSVMVPVKWTTTRHAGQVSVPKQGVKERKESYVHSSVVFLEDTRLRSGRTARHSAALRIEPVPPTHLDEAKALVRDAGSAWSFKWTVVASVNVARGRDPKRQRQVRVTLD